MLEWFLDWLESTAATIGRTKLRVCAFQLTIICAVVLSIIVGFEVRRVGQGGVVGKRRRLGAKHAAGDCGFVGKWGSFMVSGGDG